jgi:tRNA threonylcarbamoyladenosine biosynthesis protein TsaB
MLLLVTDTSGKHGFVALTRTAAGAHPDQIEVIEEVPLAGGTFSAQLVPQIAALLQKHRFTKSDIAAFIVVSGPGSFTGLRVGLAAIKALAEILQKPIVPISLLEGVAFNNGGNERVFAALDAGRGEVYVGEYEVARNETRMIREQLLPKDEFLEISSQLTIATPDMVVAEFARPGGHFVSLVERPNAAAIARIGLRKLQAGQTVTPEQLEANYIRRSDAEIFAKPVPGS